MEIDVARSTKKLKEVEAALAGHDWGSDYSLFTGKCGYLVFLNEQMRFKNNGAEEEAMNRLCESVFEDVQRQQLSVSFCQGIGGLVYTLNYLELEDPVEQDVLDSVAMSALEIAEKDNFDFLHGSTGMVYALSKNNYSDFTFFSRWMELVEKKLVTTENGMRLPMRYPGHPFSQHDYQFNYSLSHGMVAVLLVIIELLEKKQVDAVYAELLHKLVSSLMGMRNENTTLENEAFYPSVIRMDNSRQYFKRVSWCYGDLGVAIMLNRYMNYSGNSTWRDRITEILDHYLKYNNLEEIGVKDADFCHGAAGTALMYLFFYQELGDEKYKEAAVKWYNMMLQMDTFPDGVAGYKHFDPKGYFNDYGLLEGVTGIGLTLITFLSGKKLNWQSCFLIQ